MSSRESLFGAEGAVLLDVVAKIVRSLVTTPVRYTVMEVDHYLRLLKRDIAAGMKVYWEEMLGRAHLAAATSMIRSFRWCEGMRVTYDARLFLPYCASFRGLIESVADTLGCAARCSDDARGE